MAMISFLVIVTANCSCLPQALYTLPRAADSLFMLLRDRRLLASAPYGEIGLFCMATSGLMYFFQEKEGRSMSPLVNTIFKILFGRVKL